MAHLGLITVKHSRKDSSLWYGWWINWVWLLETVVVTPNNCKRKGKNRRCSRSKITRSSFGLAASPSNNNSINTYRNYQKWEEEHPNSKKQKFELAELVLRAYRGIRKEAFTQENSNRTSSRLRWCNSRTKGYKRNDSNRRRKFQPTAGQSQNHHELRFYC